MGIGPDIAEVINELGTAVSITKHDGSSAVSEYIDYEFQMDANSPFLAQYILKCTMMYNTAAVAGDIVQFVDDSTYHLLAAVTPARFEDSIVVTEGILYRCNFTGSLTRRSVERSGSTYEVTTTWDPQETDEPVLLTGMVDYTNMKSVEYAKWAVDQFNLHISGDCNPEVGDRFTIGTDNWEIKGIAPHRLNNVSICRVSQDTRE